MRRFVRRLLAPDLQSALNEMRAREAEELSALKKDLLATNHRITWLEKKLSALEDARGTR